MPMYLTRFSYTPETWARLVKNPEDRRAAARQYIESLGGKLHGFWYAFGEHDGYNLWEAPDNVSMAATAIAIGAGALWLGERAGMGVQGSEEHQLQIVGTMDEEVPMEMHD